MLRALAKGGRDTVRKRRACGGEDGGGERGVEARGRRGGERGEREGGGRGAVSYTHLRAHETEADL
eukprot:1526039-Rhodomonas_salina.1